MAYTGEQANQAFNEVTQKLNDLSGRKREVDQETGDALEAFTDYEKDPSKLDYLADKGIISNYERDSAKATLQRAYMMTGNPRERHETLMRLAEGLQRSVAYTAGIGFINHELSQGEVQTLETKLRLEDLMGLRLSMGSAILNSYFDGSLDID